MIPDDDTTMLYERRAKRDGHRPASEETWCCPNCGKPATVFTSFRRILVCGFCRWMFAVELERPFSTITGSVYEWAKNRAEQNE